MPIFSSSIYNNLMLAYPNIPRDKKPKVIFILGGPGSGKGTQSKLIQERYNLHHMSAGDLLREQRKNEQSEHGRLIDHYMVEGKIVPCEITVKLLEAQMRRKGYLEGKFLIDGFPRNKENLRRWHMHTHPEVIVPFIVVLQCGEACMLERLLQRGKTSGRIDDNVDVIKKRFETYNKETKEVIDYFKNQNRAVIVNAEGSVEQTFELVCKQIDSKIF